MTQKPKIGTIVLNYKTYHDTLACVESLKNQRYSPHAIVVVENGSGTESEQILHEAYDHDPQVTLVVSRENLGFARGNNLGIRYAREKLSCDYVFVLNSDTIVPDEVFMKVVSMDCTDVGVISPSVINPEGLRLAPSENCQDIMLRIQSFHHRLRLAQFLSMPVIRTLYSLYCRIKPQKTGVEMPKEYGKYVLQGCAFFLTPNFFKYYTQLFPETFLYWEEADLLLYLLKVGLHGIVVETPPVTHKVAQATKTLFGDTNMDRQKLKHSIDSFNKSQTMFSMSYDEIKARYN